jgi:inositol-phosphate transport system permease protein
MATETVPTHPPFPLPSTPESSFLGGVWQSLRYVLIVAMIMGGLALLLDGVIAPFLQSVQVDEQFTSALASLLVGFLPAAVYVAAGVGQRGNRSRTFFGALLSAWLIAGLAYGVYVGYQAATGTGAFREAASLGFAYQQGADGIDVISVEPGSAAQAGGILAGDVITALRRDPITASDLDTHLNEAELDDAFRFRIMRGGEEVQLTTRVTLNASTDNAAILRGFILPLVLALLGLIIPGHWVPHLILVAALLPLLTGYLWLIIASFSTRTHGMFPVNIAGDVGGLTLENWDFLSGRSIGGPTINIWSVTVNSLMIAISMTVVSLIICSMAGYALSRMSFPGRKLFLSMTLILHGFPAVTLLIPIFLVLINLGSIPLVGSLVGYNRPGGVAMVMIAFELPLGIWLLKGFFDGISWDMERSALIDGASRWRTFYEIILPQIRPGLLALGIFSFISGWNAYLIPATYSVGTGMATLPVYIRQLTGELAPVNWNQVAAVGLFQLIPILVFFVFAQEYLLNIYAGGTKGSS